jgi:hypothetical protein
LKVIWWRSIGSALGVCDSIREAAEVSIERRVLCRTTGMVDLFDRDGHSSKAALNLTLETHVRAVSGGAQQLVQSMDLCGKHPHR